MSGPSTKIWTKQKCIQLIREYRARPSLWDPEDTLHYNNSKKSVIWKDIADALNIHPDLCRRKMNVLLSSFRRSKAKILNRQITGNSIKDDIYEPRIWFAFKEMSFLLDKNLERKRQTEGVNDDEERFLNIKQTLSQEDIQFHIVTNNQNTTIYNEIPLEMMSQPVTAKTATLESTPGPSRVVSYRDEEIKFFTSFIGNKMKRYTNSTKKTVQQAICDVIFKADQNYYETGINKYPVIDKFDLIFDENSEIMNNATESLSDSD